MWLPNRAPFKIDRRFKKMLRPLPRKIRAHRQRKSRRVIVTTTADCRLRFRPLHYTEPQVERHSEQVCHVCQR